MNIRFERSKGNERIWIAQTRRTVSRKLAEGWKKMAEEKIIKGISKGKRKSDFKGLDREYY
jgi:hypothetical protein